MPSMPKPRSKRRVPSPILAAVRVLIPLLPAGLLLVGVLRTDGQPQLMVGLGCLFQILIYSLSFGTQRSWRDPLGLHVIILYLIALGWLWLVAPHFADDWYLHFAQSVLLVVPLSIFALQILTNSGAASLRRARVLAQKLA